MSTRWCGLKKDKEHPAAVLSYLKKAKNHPVTGEYIAQALGISRIAVWKQVQVLKNHGYTISSDRKHGYTLLNSPGLLLPEEIQYELRTSALGKSVIYFPSLDSTNDYAKKIAQSGAAHGTVVITETQRRGRGRLGRTWFSPARKNIYLSVILRPDILPQEAPKLTLLAGLSVAEALRQGLGVKAYVKWPNDIVVENGKDGGSFLKAGGILTEMSAESDKINFAVIGIGLNVNMSKNDWPKELVHTAIGLKEMVRNDRELSRVVIVQEILRLLESNYQIFLDGRWAELFANYVQIEMLEGKEVVIHQGMEKKAGRVEKIVKDGRLVLKTKKGLEYILAGDVTIGKKQTG